MCVGGCQQTAAAVRAAASWMASKGSVCWQMCVRHASALNSRRQQSPHVLAASNSCSFNAIYALNTLLSQDARPTNQLHAWVAARGPWSPGRSCGGLKPEIGCSTVARCDALAAYWRPGNCVMRSPGTHAHAVSANIAGGDVLGSCSSLDGCHCQPVLCPSCMPRRQLLASVASSQGAGELLVSLCVYCLGRSHHYAASRVEKRTDQVRGCVRCCRGACTVCTCMACLCWCACVACKLTQFQGGMDVAPKCIQPFLGLQSHATGWGWQLPTEQHGAVIDLHTPCLRLLMFESSESAGQNGMLMYGALICKVGAKNRRQESAARNSL